MRKTETVPVGQGCKPFKSKKKNEQNVMQGRCEEHFWLYLNICLSCGNKFHTERPHTKTCSGKCRVALHRAKDDVLFQTVMDFAGGLK